MGEGQQIRGSRYAWDIRIISVEAILKMLSLKEELDEPSTLQKIHDILFPREFTRLDDIVDLVFSAAEDAKQDESDPDDEEDGEGLQEQVQPAAPSGSQSGLLDQQNRTKPVAFHAQCVPRIEKQLSCQLIKQSRSRYQAPDGSIGVICLASRKTEWINKTGYWFAYHDYYRKLLEGPMPIHIGLACGSPDSILLIPLQVIDEWVPKMSSTTRKSGTYWHVVIHEITGRYFLRTRAGHPSIEVTQFLIRDR